MGGGGGGKSNLARGKKFYESAGPDEVGCGPSESQDLEKMGPGRQVCGDVGMSVRT